jgi:hypothetical protein
MADNYRVEVWYWYRDRHGDWDISDYWENFDTLEEAIRYTSDPCGSKDNLIEANVYAYSDNCKERLYHKSYKKRIERLSVDADN